MCQTALQFNDIDQRSRTQRFYTDIREEYTKLVNVKKYGARLYHQEQILAQLARKFYRSPKTIENIVYFRV